ncbi:MAG TPA: DUF4825 domain-containing protein [Candidatus Anaerotignum merdipullorum]|nr:DUF4825 domain-containing protein [Candidatus Anaerotignum merdipullorum]
MRSILEPIIGKFGTAVSWLLQTWFDAVWRVTPAVILCVLILMVLHPYVNRKFGPWWYRRFVWMLCFCWMLPVVFSQGAPMVTVSVPFTVQMQEEAVAREMEVAQTVGTKETFSRTELSGVEQMQPVTTLPDTQPVSPSVVLPQIEMEQVWALGMVLFFSYYLIQYLRMERYLRRGRRRISDAALLDGYMTLAEEMKKTQRFPIRRPRLYCHPGLPSSLCTGLIRKTIYIDTEDRDWNEMQWILRHEWIHCQKQDVAVKLLLLLIQMMHWFNPFVHWLVWQTEKEMELACDAETVKGASLAERKTYGMAILNSIRAGNRRRSKMTTAFMENKRTLRRRLEGITDMQPKKKGTPQMVMLILVLLFCLSSVGCASWDKKEGAEQNTWAQTNLTEQLYDAKTPYIGNASAVGKVLGLLPLPDCLTYHEAGMELYTNEEEPFGVKQHVSFTELASAEERSSLSITVRYLERNAYLFLALVENADFVEYELHDTSSGESVVLHYDREDARVYYPDVDLRTYASDLETFSAFTAELNTLFRCPFSEDVMAGAEQKSMEEVWSQTAERVSVLAQTPMETELAQWLADIRSQNEFQEILHFGDGALLYCLTELSQIGEQDTNPESYVQMLVAEEMLYDGRRTVEEIAASTPAQWYWGYCALDSTLPPASFYVGLETQYAQMPETDHLTLSADAKRSRVTSKDPRVQAVYEALTRQEATDAAVRETTIVAPLILEIEETEAGMQVYCIVAQEQFKWIRLNGTGYYLVAESGSHVPARLDFIQESGSWQLLEIHWAQDGSSYAPSIEEMTDSARLAREMISYDQEAVQRLLYDNLISYLTQVQLSPTVYDVGYRSEALTTELQRFLNLA